MTDDDKNDAPQQDSELEQELETSVPPNERDAHSAGLVDLPLGDAFTVQESLTVTLERRTQLLLIAGAVASGKTTLITSLFHLFQRGPFAGYLFAGSNTLVGFDRRCHLARTASGLAKEDTERTKRGEDRELLHFRLRREDCGAPPTDVLISDLSGENYRDAKNSIDECRRLHLLQRADHFVLLIDSYQLSQPDARQRTKNDANMLLRTCLDAGQLGPQSYVDVLFSKWDLVDENDEAQTGAFVSEVENTIRQRFDSRFKRLRLARIAARPERGSFGLGYGLADLFPSWIEDSPATEMPSGCPTFPANVTTEFDRYLKRRLLHLSGEVVE